MFSKYIHVVKNGQVITGSNIKCDRCYRASSLSYMTYDGMDICFPCVEIINIMQVNDEKKRYPQEPILLRMEIDIYKNEYINNNINYSNVIHPIRNISEFRIVDKINNQFKVSISNKIYILDEDLLIRHYWDYLSFYDKDYFLNK
jgi:hypothetical protein